MFSLCSLTFITKVYRLFVRIFMYQSSGVLDAFSSIYRIAQLLKFLPLFFFTSLSFFQLLPFGWYRLPYTYLGFRWTVVSFTFLFYMVMVYMIGMLRYSVDCSSEEQNVWATLNLLFWNAIKSEYSDGAFWISCSFLSSKQNTYAISDMAQFPVFF